MFIRMLQAHLAIFSFKGLLWEFAGSVTYTHLSKHSERNGVQMYPSFIDAGCIELYQNLLLHLVFMGRRNPGVACYFFRLASLEEESRSKPGKHLMIKGKVGLQRIAAVFKSNKKTFIAGEYAARDIISIINGDYWLYVSWTFASARLRKRWSRQATEARTLYLRFGRVETIQIRYLAEIFCTISCLLSCVTFGWFTVTLNTECEQEFLVLYQSVSEL